jgi:cyclophilin family peptidyl-prolyl cis-trans isomerase
VKTLWNWLAARKAARNVVDSVKTSISPTMVESLEDRCFLSVAAPHVVSVYADNRGLMTIKLDQKLSSTSVSSKSVKVWKATSGADQAITNASIKYSSAKRTITINAKTSADTVVKVRLLSKLIKNTDGVRLDGEFKSTGKSGNGRAGGDYFVMTRNTPDGTDPVARFTTNMGNMDVELFATVNSDLAQNRGTPITVANFLNYANAGDWDGAVFHRSVKDFVIQGGGFKVDSTNNYSNVHDNPPMITNEPKGAARPANPGNILGTIAMARQDDGNPATHQDENSATDQWYFNVVNNPSLDTSNTGFTAFGQITNAAGRAVMVKINSATIVNLNDNTNAPNSIRAALAHFFNPGAIQGAFGEFPLNGSPTVQTFSPKANSVMVTRLAVNQAVVKGVRV